VLHGEDHPERRTLVYAGAAITVDF